MAKNLPLERAPGKRGFIARATRPARALARTAVFFLKVFPMLPSKPVDWVTPAPVIEKARYPSRGWAEGEVYRPATGGPHPGILVCLGVVPFGQDHPQVPVLGRALARAGFAALLYWSPAMRDLRIDAADLEDLPLAYRWLIDQPYVDAARSGLMGTCVGGAFALMAAAHPLIRDCVAFASAYAPYSSMRTFAGDIASGTCSGENGREPWQVDQLTRKVFVRSITAQLDPGEAARLRGAYAAAGGTFDGGPLSAEGQAVRALLTAPDKPSAEAALDGLSAEMQARLNALSPATYLEEIRAPLIVLLHDRGDRVIPVGESRRLVEALAGRPGVEYTEMNFSHLDPSKGKLPLPRLIREFARFFRAMIPIFRLTVE